MTTYYCDSTASGANDGSSWADAFETLAAASAALSAGDALYLNAPESSPLVGELEDVPSRCTIIGDKGADGETWLTSTTTGTWSDEGGGVWSLPLASEPPYVVYNFRRDRDGSVTGWAPYTQIEGRALAAKGWDLAKCCAWYGYLSDAGATSTPGEGEYGYTGGTLYINPPGSPDNSTVNSLARYVPNGTQINGVSTNAAAVDIRIRGITAWLYPSVDGNQGYGIRIQGSRTTVEDCTTISCGWHSFGAATGDAGGRNVFRRCLAMSCTSSSNFVFYVDDTQANSGNRLFDCAQVDYGNLTTDGSPLTTLTAPSAPYLQHTDGVAELGGVEIHRGCFVDARARIFAVHDGNLADTALSGMTAASDPPAFDNSDPTAYPLQVYDTYFAGYWRLGPNTFYDRCLQDRSMITDEIYGSRGVDSDDGNVWFEDGWIDMGNLSNLVSGCALLTISAATKHYLKRNWIRASSDDAQNSCFFYLTVSNDDTLTLEDNTFVAEGSMDQFFVTTPAAWDDDGDQAIASGNTFSDSITKLIQHTNPGVTARDISFWQSNVSATDDHGDTPEPDRTYIHAAARNNLPSVIQQ